MFKPLPVFWYVDLNPTLADTAYKAESSSCVCSAHFRCSFCYNTVAPLHKGRSFADNWAKSCRLSQNLRQSYTAMS